MKQTPNWLVEKQITLPNGEEALWSYDTESDFLEVFFGIFALIAKKESH